MILDKLLEFDPLPTAITTTRDSTNVINLANYRDLGPGFPLWVTVMTGTTALSGGTSLIISLEASVDNSTYYTVERTGVLLTAALTASTVLWRVPVGHKPLQFLGTNPQYYKLIYTVDGTYSAGGVGAWMNLDTQMNTAYPPGIAISN